MSKEEIEAKFEIFAARKNGGGGDDAGDEEDGQLIKNEEDELEEAERKRDIKTTLKKLYELFGGMRVILQVGAVQIIDQVMDHKLRRMNTNWSKTKPEKQLENMPTVVKDIVVGKVTKSALTQGNQIYKAYRTREVSSQVHQ